MVSKRAKYGWQWGGAGPKDRVSAPTMHSFVLPHPHPTLYDGENFLAPFPPFRVSNKDKIKHYDTLFPTLLERKKRHRTMLGRIK